MYHQSSKKALLRRKVAVMLLSTTTVIIGVAVLSAFMLGYSFNSQNGRVERMGILQIDSKPGNATVYLGNEANTFTTRARLVRIAGEYDIRIERQKYHTWSKKVPLKGGGLTWVAYPRLIPAKPAVTKIADLPDTLADALPSGSSKRYAFLEKVDTPSVRIARIDRDKPEFTTVTLPSAAYTVASPEVPGDSSFKLHLWSGNERFILLQHTFNTQQSMEWILLNVENPEESVNLTRLFGAEGMSEVVFGDYNGTQLYAIFENTVRVFDIDSRTISAPLVNRVESFRLYGDGYVLFVAHDQDKTKRTIGYTKKNFKAPRVVSEVPFTDQHEVFFDIAKYYDTYYFLIANGTQALLTSSKQLPDDPKASLQRRAVETFTTTKPIISANITENGQLATVQDGVSFVTHNLELEQTHATQIKSNRAQALQKLRYLDTYLLWAEDNGMLRTYEFDGNNQHNVMPIEARFDATLSPSGKYLYSVSKAADTGLYHFNRVQLLDLPQ